MRDEGCREVFRKKIAKVFAGNKIITYFCIKV